MDDSYPASRLYQVQYKAVRDLFDQDEYKKCIAEARKNLSNLSLPSYYVVKNCMLLACAQDDWFEADNWRLNAENAYRRCFESSLSRHDDEALMILRKLRDELDKLPGVIQANTAETDSDTEDANDGMNSDEQGDFQETEEKDAIDFEDAKKVAQAENELEQQGEMQEAKDKNKVGLEDAKEVAQAENELEQAMGNLHLAMRDATTQTVGLPMRDATTQTVENG